MKFYLTFGQQSPFRNGWVEIEAKSLEVARNLAFDIFIGQCFIKKKSLKKNISH